MLTQINTIAVSDNFILSVLRGSCADVAKYLGKPQLSLLVWKGKI